MKRRMITLTVIMTSSLLTPAVASGEVEIQSIAIEATQVEGSRGAALAVGQDGTIYLGGGERGDTLFTYANGKLESIGKISTQSERRRDSRFGPTDIAILAEREGSIDFLISYPQLSTSGNCVRLVVFRYRWNLNAPITKEERWFRGTPCVPVGAVQHAAGRIETIDSKSAYLTTGDLGFREIDDRAARGRLGGVFKITAKKIEQISEGHRNPQGILRVGKSLYISEHGPRGGDEINLVEQGKDYGWPFVTLGAAYGPGDYIRPTSPGTHEGYEKPLIAWVPSIAPTELVRIPRGSRSNSLWGEMSGQVVMGTLAAESLVFLELTSRRTIKEVNRTYIGERIRDLEVGANAELIATTDSGQLLIMTRKN